MKINIISTAILLVLAAFVNLQNANAQNYPAKLLNELPDAAQILESTDVRERASILKKLVVAVPDSCTLERDLPVNFDKEDYEFVVGKILELDLSGLDYQNDAYIWGNIKYLITHFQMLGHLATLSKYLNHPEKNVQAGIVLAIQRLNAKELDEKLVPLLSSPEKFIREETLRALIHLESKKAVPALIKMLSEPDEFGRRHYALTSLVKVKGTEAAPHVSRILLDENENDRYWAIDTLVNLDAKSEAPKLWKFTETEANKRFVGYAIAALLHFGEKKAVPIAIEALKENAENKGSTELWEFVYKLKPKILMPELTAMYYRKEKFFEAAEAETKLRLSVFNLLYNYRNRELTPVYRENLFGIKAWNETGMFKEGVAQILIEVGAVEAVDDLIAGLREKMKNKTSQYYDTEIGNLAHYLAKFGSPKADPILIEVVSENKSYYRGLILAEMNRRLNPDVWKKLETAIVPMVFIESIEAFSEKATAAGGVKIGFEKDPASEKALCLVEDFNYKNGIPCTHSDGRTSVLNALTYMFSDRRNTNYTWLIDGGRIRVLPVEKSIDWWRKNILAKN